MPKTKKSVNKVSKQVERMFVRISTDIKQQAKNADKEDRWIDVVDKIKKKWKLRLVSHNGLSGLMFVNKKLGIVIKRPWRCDVQKPRKAIYTKTIPLKLDSDYDLDDELAGPIVLQPLAKVDLASRLKAMELLKNYGRNNILDFHTNNVAIYKKQPVLIDW